MKTCVICDAPLAGKQQKACSEACRSAYMRYRERKARHSVRYCRTCGVVLYTKWLQYCEQHAHVKYHNDHTKLLYREKYAKTPADVLETRARERATIDTKMKGKRE